MMKKEYENWRQDQTSELSLAPKKSLFSWGDYSGQDDHELVVSFTMADS